MLGCQRTTEAHLFQVNRGKMPILPFVTLPLNGFNYNKRERRSDHPQALGIIRPESSPLFSLVCKVLAGIPVHAG